ncbi:MAG: hypothetical protein ACREFP_00925 [Acetobacteraceae bacterium]
MPVVCVEPAVNALHSVVQTAGNDSLVFPHVDSCMTVTLFVPPDTLIGGHAGAYDHLPPHAAQPAVNLQAIVAAMQALVPGGRPITRVVFVGSDTGGGPATNWNVPARIAALRLATGNLNLPCPIVDTLFAGAVDVVFNNATMKLRVQGYQYEPGRGDLGVPAVRPALLEVPYHAIRDKQL